jgi:hypothetical protein
VALPWSMLQRAGCRVSLPLALLLQLGNPLQELLIGRFAGLVLSVVGLVFKVISIKPSDLWVSKMTASVGSFGVTRSSLLLTSLWLLTRPKRFLQGRHVPAVHGSLLLICLPHILLPLTIVRPLLAILQPLLDIVRLLLAIARPLQTALLRHVLLLRRLEILLSLR